MMMASPSMIRYVTKGISPMRFIERMNRYRAMIETMKDRLAASRLSFMASACCALSPSISIDAIPRLLAPMSTGIAVSRASLAACFRPNPYNRAIVMTSPAREAPGIRARHCTTPSPSIASGGIFSMLF